jgi:hypothetical protein
VFTVMTWIAETLFAPQPADQAACQAKVNKLADVIRTAGNLTQLIRFSHGRDGRPAPGSTQRRCALRPLEDALLPLSGLAHMPMSGRVDRRCLCDRVASG